MARRFTRVNGERCRAVMQFVYVTRFLLYAPEDMKVPNAIGFVLGSAQLILYATHKNESTSSKSTEEKDEGGSPHLVKGGIEMGTSNVHDNDGGGGGGGGDGDENSFKNRSLNKGKKSPKAVS